ncbi:MAG: hypothetical protein BWY09_01916 [Candidatus Hydrogenedentes bacterium ADurb.Bin179]|nr:MAG: hypothetical protein BWY09_01916 [Candidatus Hydrogenedentes bacterium ADurb.Bin179]
MAQFDNGLGNGKIHESVSTGLFYGLGARLEDGFRGHPERKPGDDDALERFAGDIYTLPKTVRAEQDA